MTFANVKSTKRKVAKNWVGKNNSRPESRVPGRTIRGI